MTRTDSLLGIVAAEPVGADDVTDLLLMNLKTADESLPFVFAAYTEDEVRRVPRR